MISLVLVLTVHRGRYPSLNLKLMTNTFVTGMSGEQKNSYLANCRDTRAVVLKTESPLKKTVG